MNEKKTRLVKKWLWVLGGILLLIGSWQLLANLYREEEKDLRRQFRETVKEKFPEQTVKHSQTFGLVYFEADPEAPGGGAPDRNSVVLIHGLDDPGDVWQSLAPELVKEDFNVWLMQYPNDQSIVASSQLFFEELKELKQHGISRISIVAHSMGGLVSREMLTNPEIGYHRSVTDGLVPQVAALIMVGTPNHGSQLVRLRVFTEMRDQLSRLTKGQASWLAGILDGAGEAKIDLLPGSRFLTELNARKHAQGVDMLIIAGMTCPWTESDRSQVQRSHWPEKRPVSSKVNLLGLGSENGHCWVSHFAIIPAKCRLVRLRRRNPTNPGVGSIQPTYKPWPMLEPSSHVLLLKVLIDGADGC